MMMINDDDEVVSMVGQPVVAVTTATMARSSGLVGEANDRQANWTTEWVSDSHKCLSKLMCESAGC